MKTSFMHELNNIDKLLIRKKMKIGTITFWYSKENYGAMLQCFALLRYLNQNGHDAKLIKAKIQPWSDVKYKLFYFLTNSLTRRILRRKKIQDKGGDVPATYNAVDRKFGNFLNTHIPSFPSVYTYEDLNNSPINVDAVIVGSDQVWGGFSNTYFLNFKGDFKRISYAASFGGAEFDNPFIRRKISKWLKRFDLVTVREQEGIDKCKKFGIEATLVADPTLLLDMGDYNEVADNKGYECGKPYIFLYLLGKNISVEVAEIFEFAKSNNLDIVYVASQGREDEFEKKYPTVEEWLAMVRDAKYVITNSFHGTALSLIYEKPFLTFPLIGRDSRMNCRIETMLERYHLSDRIFKSSLDELLRPVVFDYFEEMKAKDNKQVKGLLDAILKTT